MVLTLSDTFSICGYIEAFNLKCLPIVTHHCLLSFSSGIGGLECKVNIVFIRFHQSLDLLWQGFLKLFALLAQ